MLLRRQAAFRLHGLSHSPPLPVQTIVSDERLSYSLFAEPATRYIQTQYLPFHSCTQRRTQAFSRLSYPGFGYNQGLSPKIVSKKELCIRLWGTEEFIDENALQVNFTRLRKTLREFGLEERIETVRGQGYRLKEQVDI